jgi:hypothetical protein
VQTYTVLLGESVTDKHPARAFFAERYTGLRDMVTSAVSDATNRPMDDQQVVGAASAIIATMDGLQTQWLLDKDAVDMRAVVDLTIRALVRELTGP